MAYDALPFDWAAGNFATHNGPMDDEHKGLFAAIDKLHKERTLGAYEALCTLVVTHFKDEEAIGKLSDAHKVCML